MKGYNILVFGAGNCEIASYLERQLNQLELLNRPEIKLFARGHLFDKSCLALYGRLEEIKSQIDIKQTSIGGVCTYHYEEGHMIKSHEMQLTPVTRESFEEFLHTGRVKIDEEEVILVLIGQGNLGGMFLDFAELPMGQISYEEIIKSIHDTLQGCVKKLHVIVDVSNWDDITLPAIFSQCSFLESLFIFERNKGIGLFPINEWINYALNGYGKWQELTAQFFEGYSIKPHALSWDLCERKWQEYISDPTDKTREDFEKIYNELVDHHGHFHRLSGKNLEYLVEVVEGEVASAKNYFKEEYNIEISDGEMEEWVEGLKVCTDYYKL